MAVLKVIEILANSSKSWADATANGIKKAAESLSNIRSAHVASQSVVVENDEVVEYRVNLRISFEVD